MGLIKASSLRIDLSIGKYNSGFTHLIDGKFSPAQSAQNFNFSLIDTLAVGLQAQKVRHDGGSFYLQTREWSYMSMHCVLQIAQLDSAILISTT